MEFYGTKIHHRGQWRIHGVLRSLFRENIDHDFEVTRRGLKWVLNPSDYMQSDLFWLDSLENWETYHLVRLLKPGAVIFDVGANFGYYSIVLWAALRGRCQVFAFEPNPPTFLRLTKNIELNGLAGQIHACRVALSDEEGHGFVVGNRANSGAAHMSSDPRGNQVTVTTLDAFCVRRPSGIDFVKVDVEGLEERVLRGAIDCINKFKPFLMIEINPAVLALQGSSPERVVGLLRQYGYSLFVPTRKKLVPFGLDLVRTSIVNIFCFADGRLPQNG